MHCKQADSAILCCQMHAFVAQPDVLGIMCLFFAQASVQQICDFLAKPIMSRIGAFWVLFGLRIYSDKQGSTQILLRYMNKKLAVQAPPFHINPPPHRYHHHRVYYSGQNC